MGADVLLGVRGGAVSDEELIMFPLSAVPRVLRIEDRIEPRFVDDLSSDESHPWVLWVVELKRAPDGLISDKIRRCVGFVKYCGRPAFLTKPDRGDPFLLSCAGCYGVAFVVVWGTSREHARQHPEVQDMLAAFCPRVAKARKKIPVSLRYKILKRDGFCCRYCGLSAADKVVLHIDHIVPLSKGGTDDEDNLCAACESCNLGKSNRFDDRPPASRG